MTDLIVAPEQSVTTVDELPITADMTLIARTPDQLQAEQRRLIGWCDAKRNEVDAQIAELEAGIAHHRKLKWGYAPLRNALAREKQRLTFYSKVQDALEAGFYIVPNFPCDVFAIRTDQSPFVEQQSTDRRRAQAGMSVGGPALESGEGDYQNPNLVGRVIYQDQRTKSYPKGTTETEVVYHAVGDEYREMVFPFAFAKPEVLTATQQAMALKIFDELAVLPSAKKKTDPMVIGRIIRPWQRSRWNSESNLQRHLSFLVVWWLDTNTI